MLTTASSSLTDRLKGIITLKAPTYREVAEDPAATNQALTIVIIVAVISGVLGFIAATIINNALGVAATQLGDQAGAPFAIPTISPIGQLVTSVLSVIVGWVIGSWVLDFVARSFFQGRSTFQEMLRVTGFTSVFTIIGSILGLIPCVGALAGIVAVVLQLIGNVIGIREAAEVDNTKAILIAIVAAVVIFVVALIIGAIIGLVF